MELEQERGITIKLQPAQMEYKDHVLNQVQKIKAFKDEHAVRCQQSQPDASQEQVGQVPDLLGFRGMDRARQN